MAGLDGELSGVRRDVAEPSRAGIADRRIDSLRSGRRQRGPQALVDVLGDLAVIQRCQLHKLRNLRSYLPKSRHAYVLQTMKEAYKCKSADKARKRLQALVSWLERNGYDEAAGSLREGMEETLTVVKLALPELLRKSLATTNAIENLNGTIRRVSRNVKRWKSPSMIRRWTALGVVTAEKKFHRIKGYRHMGALVRKQRLEANRNLLTAMRLLCLRVFTGAAATRPNSTAAGTSRLEANRNLLTAMRLLPKTYAHCCSPLPDAMLQAVRVREQVPAEQGRDRRHSSSGGLVSLLPPATNTPQRHVNNTSFW